MFKYDFSRIKNDFEYAFLNSFVNRIPIWKIRCTIYRLFGMRIGIDARIGAGSVVYCPGKIVLGNRAIVNENCYLDGRFGLFISHDVGISAYSKIITATHLPDSNEFEYSGNKVVIRHHSWVGNGAMVLPGSRIMEYTVIGAGSVYKGRTKPGDVIVGNPGKKIKSRACRGKYKLIYFPFFR